MGVKISATVFNETGHAGGVSFDVWLWKISTDIFDVHQNSGASKNRRACVAAPLVPQVLKCVHSF